MHFMKKIFPLSATVCLGILFVCFFYFSNGKLAVEGEPPKTDPFPTAHGSKQDKHAGSLVRQKEDRGAESDPAKAAMRRQQVDKIMHQWNIKKRQNLNNEMQSKAGQRKALSYYKDLLGELKLSAEKDALFKELLVEYEFLPDNAFLDMSLAAKGEKIPQAHLQEQIEANKKELMENFRALLTDEQYVFLEYYMRTDPWRANANRLAMSMEKDIGQKLTPGNKEMFIGLIADANETLRQKTLGFSNISNSQWSAHTKQYVMDKGGTFLTPTQLKWLGQHYDALIKANKR
jgi:hypothetical protein